MEKKKITKVIGVIVGVILIGIIACILIMNNNSESSKISKKSTEIMDNFYKYMESKKVKVIYYGGDNCSYCSLETPIMKQIKKDYEIDYLYVNSDKLTKEDKDELLEVLDIEGETPTIALVKDDEVIDIKEGYIEGKEMVEFLIDNKVLKKDAVYTPEQYINNISYSDYEDMISKDEMNVVVIGQTTCSHCISTKPVLNHIAGDYDVEINYLNLTNMSSDEQTKLTNSLKSIGYEDAENLGTPLTLIVQNNKLISKIEGENPTSYYIRTFRKVGLINDNE